jgi:protoporphyrinogen oxidase
VNRPVVVAGAGPAGLTAAHELTRLGVACEVLEADPIHVGGLARTETYRGYRFDIGGHRFFTKSEEVRRFWHEMLGDDLLRVRRLSRIYYRNRFFAYPLDARDALSKLGLFEAALCGLSYLRQAARRRREHVSFEDWVVAHFGRRLYEMFFKTYTEKVWGMPCSHISADWAAQRIRGLSLLSAARHALRPARNGGNGQVVKTLIDEFEYPRLGPGMLWERVADRLRRAGVPVRLGAAVVSLRHDGRRVREVVAVTAEGRRRIDVEAVVSSMPLRSLVRALDPPPPEEVRRAAEALRYRDFLTVVLIADRAEVFPDNWIYVHDPDVRVGRIQNFKNWSPEMVPDPGRTALGLEYFCFEHDGLWRLTDRELVARATSEIGRIGLVDPAEVVDGTVVRVRKAYPVYDDAYRDHVETIRAYLEEGLENVQVCGRNGMHKYNNQDHAMMTGMMAARNVAGQSWNQWWVNEDAEYLEEIHPGDLGGRMVPQPIRDAAGA